MDPTIRAAVIARAGSRCEYCHLPQDAEPLFRFHVEHIIARQHHGSDELENLALACHHCNLHKGPNLTVPDPDDGALVPLFDPRHDAWAEHFRFDGSEIIGLTPIGRATARLLAFDTADRAELRQHTSRT